MSGEKNGEVQQVEVPAGRLARLPYQVLVAAVIFFGLFLLEYPPLFELGYWAWPYTVGYTAHKILSGLFIILNLGITQYAVRRLRFFRRSSEQGDATSKSINAESAS